MFIGQLTAKLDRWESLLLKDSFSDYNYRNVKNFLDELDENFLQPAEKLRKYGENMGMSSWFPRSDVDLLRHRSKMLRHVIQQYYEIVELKKEIERLRERDDSLKSVQNEYEEYCRQREEKTGDYIEPLVEKSVPVSKPDNEKVEDVVSAMKSDPDLKDLVSIATKIADDIQTQYDGNPISLVNLLPMINSKIISEVADVVRSQSHKALTNIIGTGDLGNFLESLFLEAFDKFDKDLEETMSPSPDPVSAPNPSLVSSEYDSSDDDERVPDMVDQLYEENKRDYEERNEKIPSLGNADAYTNDKKMVEQYGEDEISDMDISESESESIKTLNVPKIVIDNYDSESEEDDLPYLESDSESDVPELEDQAVSESDWTTDDEVSDKSEHSWYELCNESNGEF